MRFVLTLHREPEEGLGDGRFLAVTGEAGELIGGHALADPSIGVVVRVLDGVPRVSCGTYVQARPPAAAQYVIECADRERAVELAVLLLGGRGGGVDVRPVMTPDGMEM
ncbi:hypothetical protein ACFMQL_40155 [Nonomuraea fastidiosa]|uniref:hypothetical protein n=1 Tax=Nonomuraea TaxID=83681 RepID=UPI00324E48AA